MGILIDRREIKEQQAARKSPQRIIEKALLLVEDETALRQELG